MVKQWIAATAALMLAAGWCFGQDAQKRLKAALEECGRRGEPVRFEDLRQPPVPAAKNGATDLRTAAKVIEDNPAAWEKFDEKVVVEYPLGQKELTEAEAVLTQYKLALTLTRQARQKGAADWGTEIKSPVVHVLLPHLSGQKMLAGLVSVGVIHAFQTRDHAEAMERVRDLLFIGDAVGQEQFLVSYLVHTGANAMACARLGEMAAELEIAPRAGGSAERAATAEQMRAVIGRLVDDRPTQAGLKRCLQDERLGIVDTVQSLVEGKIEAKELGMQTGAIDKETAYGDALRMFTMTTAVIAAAEATDYPACLAKLPAAVEPMRTHPMLALMPAYDAVLARHYALAASRRAVATALAARWYAAEHGGKLPTNLQPLSPTYLSRVPADPCASAGKPLIYRNDAAGTIVYSVGLNGKDDGGSEKPANIKANRAATEDVVVHLTPKAKRR